MKRKLVILSSGLLVTTGVCALWIASLLVADGASIALVLGLLGVLVAAALSGVMLGRTLEYRQNQ